MLDKNLNTVCKEIESWKDISFDQVLNRKKELWGRLQGVQCSLQMRDNVEGLRRLEIKLQKEYSDILHKEELMWFQRSRTRWLLMVIETRGIII